MTATSYLRQPYFAVPLRKTKCGPFPLLFIGSFPWCIVNNGTVRVKASHLEGAPLKLQESMMAKHIPNTRAAQSLWSRP